MTPQSQAHFGVYDPSAFGWGGAEDAQAHRNLLVDFNYNGVHFPQGVHKNVAGLFTALLDEVVPLISGRLMTAPGCWGFSTTDNTVEGDRSFHSYGLAIDVNAPHNPMFTSGSRTVKTGLYVVPDAVNAIARKWGCEWGGSWTTPKDYMHFECHLAPAVAVTISPEEYVNVTQEDKQDIVNMIMAELRKDALTGRDGKAHEVSTLVRQEIEAATQGKTPLIPSWAALTRYVGLLMRGDADHPDNLKAVLAAIDGESA